MYRPSAIALANTLADLPFSASRVLLFNIIVYFLSGMHRSAGAFFTFHLFNYVVYLAMQGFFRTFGLICVNFDSAFRLAVFFIPNLLAYPIFSQFFLSNDILVFNIQDTLSQCLV
jgi:ATP-binding cassette, subfamily G (WHITE), member 2, SNQ2